MNESTNQGAGELLSPPDESASHLGTPRERAARPVLPWVIAAIAVTVAAVAVGVLVASEASEPKPVAQLDAQSEPAQGPIPLDDETAANWSVAEDDFTFQGAYGDLQVWSASTPETKRCLALVVDDRISLFRCAAPSLDTIADFDIDPSRVPPAPSGEPAANVRFVLHGDVVDVYLAPNPEGGYY
ncbi:UNVERIFIED_CONTAM: hypothetical protein OHV15_07895 [Microbacterium sp. SLM126]